MSELERIETPVDKVSDFQKKYNVSQKKIAYIIGKNLALFVCMLIPLILIGFVWTDFGEIVFHTKMIADGALTVSLFIAGEVMMTRLGTDGGKMDSDYIAAKGDFEESVKIAQDLGTALLGVFCDWQIDLEMEQAINYRLRLLRMTRKQFDEVKDFDKKQLEEKFGKEKGHKIFEIINLKPIELNEAILLYNGEYTARGGVPESGDAYLRRKSHIITTIIACVFTGLLTVTIAITLTTDVSFARVVYTVFKLTMLLTRMVKGFDRGARAYNTIEVRQLKAKVNYLKQYAKFVKEKIYENLSEKYDEINQIIGKEQKEKADV